MFLQKIIFLFISNCFIVQLFAQSLTEYQYYDINSSADTLLSCQYGTQLWISANSFELESVEDELLESALIRIRVLEAYTQDDMIMAKLSTESQEGLLVSNGMIEVRAFYEEKTLNLKTSKEIRVEMPAFSAEGEMLVYDLADSIGSNWVQSATPLEMDTCLSYVEIPIYKYTTVSKKEFKKWNKRQQALRTQEFGSGIFGYGGFRSRSKNQIWQTYEQVGSTWECREDDYSLYRFSMTNLGWKNIDHFKKISDPVYVRVYTEETLDVFLLIDNKVCVRGKHNAEEGYYSFTGIPKNSSGKIVGYSEVDKTQVLVSMTTFYFLSDKKRVEFNLAEAQKMSFGVFRIKMKKLLEPRYRLGPTS